MNTYTFDRVIDFFTEFNLDTVYHNKREYHLLTNHPAVYSKIISATEFLTNTSFVERIYCYTNNISTRPKCTVCENEVRYSRDRRYNQCCSQRCSLILSSLSGNNPSQLQLVKDKKKEAALGKYGVDNVSKSVEMKKRLSAIRIEYWNTVYQHKDFSIDGLSRKQYRHRAQQYADTQYARFKEELDPTSQRSKDWHVDHIYSVLEGFINEVPINVISDISNLRMLTATNNYKKSKSSHKTLSALYEDYAASQSS